ncbi:MAG: xanthine dehydrogenase accessory protein XdhC [Betaproteobacteria bacterium]|jgi:xanthine dehydrogenase accessory factor|nr:xanthine dehydrogenase accessory protein XdhC [Betaproteobacteria bacterium]NBP46170.1 xanthine dehydrogenase accessory protein XdhC [Betaproteobacteria bacterium]
MHHEPSQPVTDHAQTLAQRLGAAPQWVWVEVSQTQGSVPREVGTWMLVSPQDVVGTIGGGRLEFEAIHLAREGLRQGHIQERLRMALGPSLGQCCGGVVEVSLSLRSGHELLAHIQAMDAHRRPVALFGGGHVGRALVHTLAPLPYRIHWVDSRDEIFPSGLPAHVLSEHSDPVQASVWDLPPDSAVLIMSFSHAEDLDILAQCLKRRRERGDLPFIGLIGSKTKWATFRHRLEDKGHTQAELDGVTCPIGLGGISGKQPEVIAVAVAAQLLQVHSPYASPQTS